MTDERERFQVAIHKMRDAFAEVRQLTDWESGTEANGTFFDGYAEVKKIFGDVLLQRDVTTAQLRLGGKNG